MSISLHEELTRSDSCVTVMIAMDPTPHRPVPCSPHSVDSPATVSGTSKPPPKAKNATLPDSPASAVAAAMNVTPYHRAPRLLRLADIPSTDSHTSRSRSKSRRFAAPDSPALVELRRRCMISTPSGMFYPSLSKITDGVFITDAYTSQNMELFETHDITHLIQIIDNPKQYDHHPLVFFVNQVAIADSGRADIYSHLSELAHWIDGAVETGGRVLVHSMYGMSRSVSVVMAYLIMTQRLSADAALHVVRAGRRVAQPNAGFMYQLRLFQREQERKRIMPAHLRHL